jgi:chaperone required for assembly of F1-ATPase
MTGWAPKRFWTKADVAEADGGFAILLDGRAVRTPAKVPLIVPTRPMAEAIAAEWQAQGAEVAPRSMLFTRSANAAIDKVRPAFAEVVNALAAFGASDLLCYRAEGPESLVARQAKGWDPVLTWAAQSLDAPLRTTVGVMHVAQPQASLDQLTLPLHQMTAFQLTGLHDLVTISGSLVLALGVARQRLTMEEAWLLSRLDDHWQAQVWGWDAEAEAQDAARRDAFVHAGRFYRLST